MTRLLAGAWLLVVVACVSVTGGPTSPPPTDRPTPTAPATTQPAASLPPSEAPDPTATPSVRTEPEPTDDEPPLPPTAVLTLADGISLPGTLGSYAYGGAAADTPWLPARALRAAEVGVWATLTLTVDPAEAFVRWGARYAAADDETGDVITQLAAGGDGTTPLDEARLGPLPSGEWVVMVQLFFADEAGDAAYYWHVIVP